MIARKAPAAKTAPGKAHGHYAGLIAIVASAAVAAASVFGLFNSVLSDLVPPIEDAQLTVGFASLGTAVLLLALSLAIQRRITQASARRLAIASAVLLAAAALTFFALNETSRAYVYRFPPASSSTPAQTKHARGEITPEGRARLGKMTVSQAVFELGGPDNVNNMGILWSEESRLHVLGRLQMLYVALALSLTCSIFVAGIAVWRRQP